MMILRRGYCEDRADYLECKNRVCDNIMSKYSAVEERILQALQQWLDSYRLNWESDTPKDEEMQTAVKRKALSKAKQELDILSNQLERTHDLLEQGVYDTNMFLDRSRSLNERMSEAKQSIAELSKAISDDEERATNRVNIIPKVEHLLAVYNELPDAKSKNDMLKDVLERIEYVKNEVSPRKGPYDKFKLVLYPKLPRKK